METKPTEIAFECKKSGFSRTKNGGWLLRLRVAAADVDHRITDAKRGTRYALTLTEIETAPPRDKWADLGATRQAAIRCKEPVFWAFLSEVMFGKALPIRSEDMAATVVRQHCAIQTRADLDKPGAGEARRLWHNLDHMYQAWKVKERG